jgi:hypothetical protein
VERIVGVEGVSRRESLINVTCALLPGGFREAHALRQDVACPWKPVRASGISGEMDVESQPLRPLQDCRPTRDPGEMRVLRDQRSAELHRAGQLAVICAPRLSRHRSPWP